MSGELTNISSGYMGLKSSGDKVEIRLADRGTGDCRLDLINNLGINKKNNFFIKDKVVESDVEKRNTEIVACNGDTPREGEGSIKSRKKGEEIGDW